MALHIDVPVLLKVRDGIRVNVSLAVTHAVEVGKTQYKVKDAVQRLVAEGKRDGHSLGANDYEEAGKADTISFWFLAGSSVQYAVGQEISQEDFDRMSAQLLSLELRVKND